MANVPIPSLPLAIGLDGSEQIEIVQAGTSKRTYTGTIGDLFVTGTASYVLATVDAGLSGSRVLAVETNVLTKTDGGAQSSLTIGVATNGITDAKFRQSAALSVVGNATNATANVADIATTSGTNAILKESGGALVWGTANVVNGGTGRVTLTNHGLLIGAGTSAITQLSVAASGTLLSGVTASDPAFTATPTLGVAGQVKGTLSFAGNTSGTVLMTPQAVAGTPTLTLPTSTGTLVSTAVSPLAINTTTGAVSITGLTGRVLAGASPAFTATPTLGIPGTLQGSIALCGATSGQLTIIVGASSGTYNFYLPTSAGSAGQPMLSGGGAAPMTFGTLSVAGGGTGQTTLGNHEVLIGAATSGINSAGPTATAGVPLISNGSSSDPSFGTALVAGGGTGATSFTAYAVICGGTTATGALQSIAGVGTAGQALLSGGAGALPSFGDTVSSVATAGLASGGPITTTGTVTVTAASQSDQETGTSTSVAVTPGVQKYHPSAAKGWVRCGVTGNVLASFNVSSVTDTGVGIATVNWTTSFSSVNYVVSATVEAGSSIVANAQSIAVGSVAIWAYVTTTGGSSDPTTYCVAAYGDQ